MPFNLNNALKEGYSHEEIVNSIGPTLNYNIEDALKEGYSYQEIAEDLSKRTFPPYRDTAEAIKRLTLPKISDPNNMTAFDRARIDTYLKDLEPEVSHAARINAISEMKRREYGEIRQEYPSFKRALSIKNISKNLSGIIEGFGSLMAGLPIFTIKQIKEVSEKSKAESKQRIANLGGPPLTEEDLMILNRPYYIEEKIKEGVEWIREGWPYFKERPFLHAGFWMEENPVDTVLFGMAAWQALGAGLRGAGQVSKLAKVQDLLKISGRDPFHIANIELARHYSKNPLTKAFIQKPFDAAMEKWPKLKIAIKKYKGGKMTTQMRNKYADMNITERIQLHQQIFSELEKLSPDELKMAVPLLEGRLHFMKNLPGDVQGVVDLSKGAKRVIKGPEMEMTPESLAKQYGLEAKITKGVTGGEYSGGTIFVGDKTTPGKAFAADWTGGKDFTTVKNYPENVRSSAHEIAHGLFSKNPEKGHAAIEELKRLGVSQDVAFESLVDMGGVYLLEPAAIKNPKIKTILDKWLSEKAKKRVVKEPEIPSIKAEGKIPIEEVYKALKDEKGYSSVEIADLRDRLGITQTEIERIIKGDPEHFATASGDWSLSSEHIRSGAVEMLPGKKDLLVKVREGAKVVPEAKGIPEVGELAKFWEEGGIPSTIGRGMENINPQRLKDFEGWYRGFQKEIEHGFKLNEKMTAKQLEDVIYQPIEIETGLSRAAIMEELGDFLPAYVHHYFPEKAKDMLGVHFAETTGKRYKPGALKHRLGAQGYSEDMTEVLPRLASSYVKWKNTQAFLKEFEDTFATVVNYNDIKKTAAGLKVGEALYPNHKIVAPDGILRFYKGKVDAWKEITKRMDDTVDFDEAVIGYLQELQAEIGEVTKEFLGVTTNIKVWLVPAEAYAKLETMATPFFGSKSIQNVVRIGVDTPVNLWKDLVLLSPRWIKNNVSGDIIFTAFEGVGPLSFGRAAQSYIGKYKDVFPLGIVEASFANLMKYNAQLGTAETTVIGNWIKKAGETVPAKIASKIKDIGYGINTAFEQPFVRALYIKLARTEAKNILKAEDVRITPESILSTMGRIKDTPGLYEPIINKLKETLPVFNTLGYHERMYGRRAMPFINWYKFMLKYGAKLPAKHPFKLAGVRGLSELGEKERENAFILYFPYMKDQIEKEGGIPKRFSGLWPIAIDEKTGEGIFFNTRGMNPFNTLEDFRNMRFFSMMSPIIKVGAERALGIDTFTGRKFTTPYPLDVSPEGEVEEKDKPKPDFFHHVFRQTPQFTSIEQILTPAEQYSEGTIFNPKPIRDPITGEPKYPINSLDKIFNYMGIDRKTIDVEEWFYKHENRIRNKALQTYKNLLFEPHALTLEEHKAIVNDIKNDEQMMGKIREAIKRRERYEMTEKKEELTIIKKSREK